MKRKGKLKKLSPRLTHSKYDDVLSRRNSHDLIVKVRCNKPKGRKILTMHPARRDSKGEYPNKILVFDLVKFGYN